MIFPEKVSAGGITFNDILRHLYYCYSYNYCFFLIWFWLSSDRLWHPCPVCRVLSLPSLSVSRNDGNCRLSLHPAGIGLRRPASLCSPEVIRVHELYAYSTRLCETGIFFTNIYTGIQIMLVVNIVVCSSLGYLFCGLGCWLLFMSFCVMPSNGGENAGLFQLLFVTF